MQNSRLPFQYPKGLKSPLTNPHLGSIFCFPIAPTQQKNTTRSAEEKSAGIKTL